MDDAIPHPAIPELEFIPGRKQDAYPTIRGFVHQVDVTIRRWLELDEHATLELERGEDINQIAAIPSNDLQEALLHEGAARERLLDQIKHLEKNVTLRSPELIKAIYDFVAHRRANSNGAWNLRFQFTTTGKAVREQTAVLSQLVPAEAAWLSTQGVDLKSPGIALWNELATGSLSVEAQAVIGRCLRLLVRDGTRPSDINEESWDFFRASLADEHEAAFLDLVQHFEISTGDSAGESLRHSLEVQLERAGVAPNAAQAARLYEHLFSHVFRLLSTSGLKQLTYNDLLIEAQRTEDQDGGLVRAFEHYLNHEVSERLSELQLRWREARYVEVETELERLMHPARQSMLDSARKAQVLTMACHLELQLSRDLVKAADLTRQVEELGEDATLLRAYLMSAQGDPACALALVQDRADRESIHFRAGVQLEAGHIDVVALALQNLIRTGQANGETHRLLALTMVASGDLQKAREHVDIALSSPEADESARLAGAIVAFHEALSPVLWERLEMVPVPHPTVMVRRDDESAARLLQAAQVFEQAAAAGSSTSTRSQHFQIWQLACLANRLKALEVAVVLATSLLEACPADPHVLHWVYARGLHVDLSRSREVLMTRLLEAPVDPQDVQALVFVHLADGDTAAVETLLEKHATLLKAHQTPGLETWHLEPSLTPEHEREELRALTDLAQREQNAYEAVLAFLALALAGEWDVIAPHAQWLVERTQTFGALQLGATAAFNVQNFAVCRDLLETNIHLCPGGHLSLDLQRLLAESRVRTGDLPGALREAEGLLHMETEEDPVLLYTWLLMALGDNARLQVTAREQLRSERVPPGLLLALADEVFDDDPELAKQLWQRADEIGFSPSLVGSAIGIAATLGLEVEMSHLLNEAWLLGPEETGVLTGHFESLGSHEEGSAGGLTEDDLQAYVSGQNEAARQIQAAHLRGEIPIHEVWKGGALAAVIHGLLQDRLNHPDPPRLGLLGRHGSRGLPHDDGRVTRLTLDVTALITAMHMELLPVLETVFLPLQVTPFLMLALTQAVQTLRPAMGASAHQAILDAVRSRRLRVLPEDAPRNLALTALGDHWDVLQAFSQQEDVPVVDDLATRLHALKCVPEAYPGLDAVLPSKILDALEAEGLVDEDQIGRGKPALWSAHSQSGHDVMPGMTLAMTVPALNALARARILEVAIRHFDLVVAQDALNEAERWLEQERQRNETRIALEKLRRHLRRGLSEERYVLLPHPVGWEQRPIDAARNDLAMIRASSYGPEDALWVEDRHISAEKAIGEGQIWTLTDVLEALRQRGHLSSNRPSLLLQRQRQAGIGLTPTHNDEILAMLKSAEVREGRLISTSALRAWAAHVQAIRTFAPALQASELSYAWALVKIVLSTIKRLWSSSDETTVARAGWLLENAPLSVPAMLSAQEANQKVLALEAINVARLIPLVLPGEDRAAFAAWWKKVFLDGNRESVLAALAEHFVAELNLYHSSSTPAVRWQWLQERVRDLPAEVKEALWSEPRLRQLTMTSHEST